MWAGLIHIWILKWGPLQGLTGPVFFSSSSFSADYRPNARTLSLSQTHNRSLADQPSRIKTLEAKNPRFVFIFSPRPTWWHSGVTPSPITFCLALITHGGVAISNVHHHHFLPGAHHPRRCCHLQRPSPSLFPSRSSPTAVLPSLRSIIMADTKTAQALPVKQELPEGKRARRLTEPHQVSPLTHGAILGPELENLVPVPTIGALHTLCNHVHRVGEGDYVGLPAFSPVDFESFYKQL